MIIRIKVKFTDEEKEIIKKHSPELFDTIETEEALTGWSEWDAEIFKKLAEFIAKQEQKKQERLP